MQNMQIQNKQNKYNIQYPNNHNKQYPNNYNRQDLNGYSKSSLHEYNKQNTKNNSTQESIIGKAKKFILNNKGKIALLAGLGGAGYYAYNKGLFADAAASLSDKLKEFSESQYKKQMEDAQEKAKEANEQIKKLTSNHPDIFKNNNTNDNDHSGFNLHNIYNNIEHSINDAVSWFKNIINSR